MSVRTSTRKAELLEPGDRVMLMGIRVAVVKRNWAMVERMPIGQEDMGQERGMRDIHWRCITVVWENTPNSPEFDLVVEGNKFVRLRDTN